MNPKNYTEYSYIGKNAIEQRRKRLEKRFDVCKVYNKNVGKIRNKNVV